MLWKCRSVCIAPKVPASPCARPPVEERVGALFVAAFQPAPALDGLLWFFDAVLPRVLEAEPSFLLYVPREAWSSVFIRTHPLHRHLVEVEHRDLQSPRFIDRFRVVVAPFRFGPGVPGLLQMALARGVPCVSTPHGSAGLAPEVRGPDLLLEAAEEIADAISRLRGEPWAAASRAAASSIAREHTSDDARATIVKLCADLGLSSEGGTRS
jgi:glycosyltransferase involved in cell wall biosynthesis